MPRATELMPLCLELFLFLATTSLKNINHVPTPPNTNCNALHLVKDRTSSSDKDNKTTEQ